MQRTATVESVDDNDRVTHVGWFDIFSVDPERECDTCRQKTRTIVSSTAESEVWVDNSCLDCLFESDYVGRIFVNAMATDPDPKREAR